MSDRKYFPQYKAFVDTDTVSIRFSRLFEDERDIMSDCLKPQWEAKDDFIITISKVEKREETKKFEIGILTSVKITRSNPFEIRTTDKKLANYIWWLAKHGTTYEQFKEMNEATEF